jgi:pimeloyl-ACP methyl ester carboxylesterase
LSLPFREQFFSAEDGLRLYARLYGEGAPGTLPVVCLSGLTRNSREFHPLACALGEDGERPRKIVALDYRGRGRSAHDRDWRNYNVLREARDVVTALTVLGIERAVFIGSSRGALVIMTLAAIRPAAIAATILNDAGPVMEGSGLVRIRSQLERMPKPASFEEAVRLLRAAHGGRRRVDGRLEVAREASHVCVRLLDRSPQAPVVRAPRWDAAHGRGLWLVRETVAALGHTYTSGGKWVWFRIAVGTGSRDDKDTLR